MTPPSVAHVAFEPKATAVPAWPEKDRQQASRISQGDTAKRPSSIRRRVRSLSLGDLPPLPQPKTEHTVTRSGPPSPWTRAKPIVHLAAQNLLTAASIGAVFASRHAGDFHTLGIGKAGLLALYATPGGWSAAICHTVAFASALFGATWGRSQATPNDPRGIARFYAKHWPAVVLGSTFALSGALGLVTTLPIGVSLGLACTYISVTAAAQSLGRRDAWAGDVTSLTIGSSFALGLSFALGTGLPHSLALLHATTLLAASMGLSLGYHVAMRVFQKEFPTPYTDPLAVKADVVASTRLAPDLAADGAAGEPSVQTVFQTPPAFADCVRQLQQALDAQPEQGFAGFWGQPVITVCGAPGGGKSTSAIALAQALSRPGRKAQIRTVHRDDLEQNQVGELPIVALNLAQALLECDYRGRTDGAPVILNIEEIESVFPKLNAPKAPPGQYDENFMQSLGFLFVVQLLHLLSQTRSGVVVYASTNFAPEVRPLLDLLTTRAPIFFASPTPETRRAIILSQIDSLGECLAREHQLPKFTQKDFPERLDALLRAVETRDGGLSGRDLATVIGAGKRGAIALFAETQQQQQVVTKEALGERIYNRIEAALEHLPKTEVPSVASDPSPETLPQGGHTLPSTSEDLVSNVEHVLKKLHVSDMEAPEVVERLVQAVINLGKRYADPTNTASLAILKVRLALTLTFVLWLLKRASQETLPHKQFRDVPEVSPLKSFFGGESPKAWLHILRIAKTGAALNSAAVLRLAQHVYNVSGFDIAPALDRMRVLQTAMHGLPERARTSFAGASSSMRAMIPNGMDHA